MDDLTEMEIGSSVESFQKFLDSQRELFHSQIDQFQKIVVAQCNLTGANPLSQEMAAGALSINIGKRPRDLLNPMAIKYMQSVFSIKDAISKKESRELGALFGVTITQVRDFFNSQRSRVRKLVQLSRDKATRSSEPKELLDGVSTSSDSLAPIDPVPLNTVGPSNVEDAPSCSTQDDALSGLDDLDKHFVENIFNLMRKEEMFSGQVKLMEWMLQIQNSSVLCWFLTKGGVMILATWLSQAAVEEQTSVVLIVLKVLCHLPLHKAPPVHMSAVLQSVNRLRFYRTSDISNRARVLLSRWSKLLAKREDMKKLNGMKACGDSQQDLVLLKRSIDEVMGDDESWKSNEDTPGHNLALPFGSAGNSRRVEASEPLKLLTASSDESNKKQILGVSQFRERRKVQLVEQPGQKSAGRSMPATRAIPVSKGRPMSADDIQKAKMRAQYMQSKYGKSGSSNENKELKTEGVNSLITSEAITLPAVPKVPVRSDIEEPVRSNIEEPVPSNVEEPVRFSIEEPVRSYIGEPVRSFIEEPVQSDIEEPKKPVTLPLKERETPNRMETLFAPKLRMGVKVILEKCQRFQIPWKTPPEIKLSPSWGVSCGENGKETEVQKNRNRREKETIYQTAQEIPLNPKEPWDIEMDYDDSLTPEISIEQPPDPDAMETQASFDREVNNAEPLVAPSQGINGVASLAPALPQTSSSSTAEPDLELLAVLLKNPELVFALTSGQAGNLSSEDTVKLLDMIKAGGADNLNGLGRKMEERVEVSLPSPTPTSNPGTSGWRPDAARNAVPQQMATTNMVSPAHIGVPPQRLSSAQPPVPSYSPEYFPSPTRSSHQFPFTTTMQKPASNMAVLSGWGESRSNVNQTPLSNSYNVTERQHNSFPSFSSPLRQQRQPQQPLQQQTRFSEPHYLPSPMYQSKPPMRKSGPPPPDNSWRARQDLPANYHYVEKQNQYNPAYGGPLQPQFLGPPWDGNEDGGNEDFESWSPENSLSRNSEYMYGREPSMNSRRGYRADQARQGDPYGYLDPNRQGNRWPDRGRH